MPDNKTATRNIGPRRVVRKLLIALARQYLVPSKIRVRLLSYAGVKFDNISTTFIGDSVVIDDISPDSIRIGRYVRLTSGCVILVHYLDTTHPSTPEHPFHFVTGSIRIEDYVFIGARTIIAKPVRIGKWAVIGANSVVTTDVPPGAIVVGSPARIVGYRKGFEEKT